MKFIPTPTAAQADDLAKVAERLEQLVAKQSTATSTQTELQERIAGLREEETAVSARMALPSGSRAESRSIATELAAIRIEIEQANRELNETEATLEPATVELRNALRAIGQAIETVCNASFVSQIKDQLSGAVAPFFLKRETALHFSTSSNQTDAHRAVLGFLQSLRHEHREPEEALNEASRRLEIVRRIEAGEPVFEFKSLSAAA